jgi:hypothetical protein
MINEIILFYQNFRFNGVIRDFYDEKIDSRAKVPSLATLTRHYPMGSALQQNENIIKTIIYFISISSSEKSLTTPLNRKF